MHQGTMSSAYAVPIPLLPPGTKPLNNQVAGHRYGEGKTKLGCLQHDDGTMLKPVQTPPRGQREVDFYKAVFSDNCADKVLIEMREFMPKFHGVIRCSENVNVKYLKLENCMVNFSKPCVVDIKMGKVTYDPEAPPEKIAKEISRFPPMEKLGYQLSGMQAYDPVKGKFMKYDKYYCKKLFEDTMVTQGLGKFFLIDSGLRKDVIKLVLEKLRKIEAWFLSQKRLSFFASSILIVWEGDVDHTPESSEVKTSSQSQEDFASLEISGSEVNENDTKNNKVLSAERHHHNCCHDTTTKAEINHKLNGLHIENCEEERKESSTVDAPSETKAKLPCAVDIRMIDFAHVFTTTESDSNYLFGLQNLIGHLETLINMPS